MTDTTRRPMLLLVEDNEADAHLVQDLLEDLAADHASPWPLHEVRHAPDLKTAIDVLAEGRPRCVLLDLGLPDATGMKGINRLLLDDPSLPIVVLTGDSDPQTAQRSIRQGAQDFLSKGSLNQDLLARTVEHAVQRAEAAQAVLESNQALASFASMVAHDLRSPLSIAKGMLELVQRQAGDDLDPQLSMLIDRSVGALGRTSDLVNALLMYARAKNPDNVMEDVDLGHAARRAVEAIAAADDADIGISDHLPTVQASGAALRQVFQNLVSNAIKYADPERRAAVRIEADAQPGQWVVSVIDNGPGIPAESRSAAFDEGQRLGQTGDGFGLGLPSVRATIERYGGKVWIDDAPEGPGTAIRFTLPRPEDPA